MLNINVEKRSYVLIGAIAAAAVIIALSLSMQNQYQQFKPPSIAGMGLDDCVIENPDPDGYLLKICEYLVTHKETVYPNKMPNEYNIERIESGGEYIKVYLDCCFGAGDIASFDKQTKEVVSFSVGDI